MMADLYFACRNCGPQDDPLGDSHGCCPICGSPLERLIVPQFEPNEPDGIQKHWWREELKP